MDYLIVRNNITNKTANWYRIGGGGIEGNATNFIIKNSQIYNNTVGLEEYLSIFIHNDEVRIELNNVEIYNNNGGLLGGGLRVLSTHAELIFQNVNIYNNSADYGGGMFASFELNLFENVNIYNNSAIYGGGIFFAVHYGVMSNINIYGNNAEYGGGVYYHSCYGPQMMNCEIFNNTAVYGGGIKTNGSENIELQNLTIVGNTATLGGSIRIDTNSSINLSSCILWGNSDDEISIDETSTVDVNYSLISGGYPGTGNIDEYPLFSDLASWDLALTWEHDPEPDSTKSPCIDTGDPLFFDPDGTRSDMGAIPYEQSYTPLTAGDISGILLCSESPYYVYGNLTIPAGEELIIEPCVYIVFQGEYNVDVLGRLLAEGTVSNKITFYPADSEIGWQGLRFQNTSTNGQDSSKLIHCRFLNGSAKGFSGLSSGGAIYASQSSDLLIDHCYFKGNRALENGGAICLKSGSSPDIRNSTFLDNTGLRGGAIYCYDNTNSLIFDCSFSNNNADYGGAIYASSCAPEFSGSSIVNNHATKFGGAIYHSGGQFITFDETNQCSIYDNYADYAGLDFYTTADVYIPPVHDISLDTATVASMNQHFAFPFHLFNISSNHSKYTQENSDLFVNPTGSDLNSGTSAVEPLKTIKTALIKIIAEKADPKTIHLADGIYSPKTNNETFPINHRSYVTLSGESRANTRIYGENLYRLMVSYADTSNSVSGMTFTGAYKDGDGGAIVIENYSNPVFYETSFHNNYSTHDGGAIWSHEDCSPTFSYVSFINNASNNAGGALWCQSIDTIVMDSVLFSSNESLYSGGGLYVNATEESRLSRCLFNNNSLSNGGGGGAMFRGVKVTLDNVIFNANYVIGDGGGFFASYNADIEMKNCSFYGNAASVSGGGMYFYHGVDINMLNVIFKTNSSVSGGGIWGYYGSTLDIRNGLFVGNNTLYDPFSDGDGGAMNIQDVATTLSNVTLIGNVADGNGGGIRCWATSSSVNFSFQNSILWGNAPNQLHLDYNAVADVNYCDISGGWPSGTENINQPPLFYNPISGDYSLSTGSPCIDAGNPDTTGLSLPDVDLARNPRVGNNTIDMGAYEYYSRHQLDLKVILEGAYNGIDMDTILLQSDRIPLDQPFNIPPWNYYDSASVSAVPDSVIDWVLLELRHSPSYITLTKVPLFLKYNGVITNLTGAPVSFQTNIPNIYAVIYHRNHLGIMSANPLVKTGDIYSYDFTAGANQAYGTNAQKNLGSGIFGLYGGDGNADGTIDIDDKTTIWAIEAGSSGYLNGDFNMDSQTNNTDKNDIWNNNIGNTSQIPD